METKTCKTCNETKDVSKFSGRKLKCKSCFNKEYVIKYYPKKRTIEQIKKQEFNKKLKNLNKVTTKSVYIYYVIHNTFN